MPEQATPHWDPRTLISPEVSPDQRVTFRIYAPKAREVSIHGDWILQGLGTGGPLQKDRRGVWSITVGPLAPDFYTYTLTVDGVPTIDPRNTMVKPGGESMHNMFQVPGEEAAFADGRPVPHGDVRLVWVDSVAWNGLRRMHIYTPPDYDERTERYPVLYLIHGVGDDDAGWSTIGRAGFIIDNLLAADQVKPMIIVMPNASVYRPGVNIHLSEAGRNSPVAIAERIETVTRLHELVVEDLLESIIPAVEKRFRVLANRETRAIAGLSFGGAQTLMAVPSNLDKFAYAGVFSMGLQGGADAGLPPDFEERNASFFADPDRTNELLKLLWIASGQNDLIITDGAHRLSETLARHGIRHELHESEGGHTWINWRRYLRDFLPLLFQD